MSEEELQVLITLDDPEYGPEEDGFHLKSKDTLEHWPQPAETASDDEGQER